MFAKQPIVYTNLNNLFDIIKGNNEENDEDFIEYDFDLKFQTFICAKKWVILIIDQNLEKIKDKCSEKDIENNNYIRNVKKKNSLLTLKKKISQAATKSKGLFGKKLQGIRNTYLQESYLSEFLPDNFKEFSDSEKETEIISANDSRQKFKERKFLTFSIERKEESLTNISPLKKSEFYSFFELEIPNINMFSFNIFDLKNLTQKQNHSTSAANYLKKIDQFALIFSGLMHDISHTGKTNAFEINSLTKLAVRYHDKSVLEQHHAAKTFKILLNDETNILENIKMEELKEIRKRIINNILATDMKEHFLLVEKFEKKIKNENNIIFGKEDDDILVLSGILIHCSDFTGAIKKFDISRIWSYKVNEEFKIQSKEEVNNNLPITPYYKNLDDPKVMAKSEMQFINFIVLPLWTTMNSFLENDLKIPIENLKENMKQWELISKNEEDNNNLNK